jgi:signal transduction histidine kinase
MANDERMKSFDALVTSAAAPEERKALGDLRDCLVSACPDADDLALLAKSSIADQLKSHRKTLASRQEAGRLHENIIFGLLGVAMLLALYLAFYGNDRRAEKDDAGASADEDVANDADEADAKGEGESTLEEEYRKRLEQLYEVRKQGRENARFAAFGEIAAGLSHGLKTPLACVRAATQVAQAKLDGEHPAQQNLDSVIDEVDDLVSQINRFLKTMGGGAPVLKRLDPKILLQAIDKRYRQGLPDRKIRWRVSVSDDAQDILGEAELIEMALRNLIDNALEATSPGSEVLLQVQRCPAPSRVGIDAVAPSEELSVLDWSELAILDRGPGMEQDIAYREKVESTRDGGSGLGIAIARRIAARLGGTLTLSPREDGEGTRASFILPPCPDEVGDDTGDEIP